MQCLANPHYLNFLAQRGYFKEQSFINYLKYLLYWKKPEYAKFLKYPQCLHFLELLQYEHFRRELVNPACAKFIDEQQILHWQYYSRKRMKINLPKSSGQTGSTTEGEPSWNCKLCRKKCGQDVSTEMANNLEIWVGSFNTKLSSSSFTLFFFIKYPLLSSLADIKVSVILTGYRSKIFLW